MIKMSEPIFVADPIIDLIGEAAPLYTVINYESVSKKFLSKGMWWVLDTSLQDKLSQGTDIYRQWIAYVLEDIITEATSVRYDIVCDSEEISDIPGGEVFRSSFHWRKGGPNNSGSRPEALAIGKVAIQVDDNNHLHKTDGPAVHAIFFHCLEGKSNVFDYEYSVHMLHGMPHRLDGPAIEVKIFDPLTQEYILHIEVCAVAGKLHNVGDAPAIYMSKGDYTLKLFFENGTMVSGSRSDQYCNMTIDTTPHGFVVSETYVDSSGIAGVTHFDKTGDLHNPVGPAVITPRSASFYLHGRETTFEALCSLGILTKTEETMIALSHGEVVA